MEKEYPDFTGFEWNQGNKDKNQKHNVEYTECEQIFFNEPIIILDDATHSVAEMRSAAFGVTNDGRRLVVIYTLRNKKLRVISARDMSRKERRFYERF